MSEKTTYTLEVVAPIFPVTDVARAIAYFTEKLAFEIAFEWADGEGEPIRYAILQNGNTELHLSESAEARETVAYFFVDNVQGFYEMVNGKGAIITSGIEDYPWDMREFEAADPDGNRLIFGEHLSRIEGAAGGGTITES